MAYRHSHNQIDLEKLYLESQSRFEAVFEASSLGNKIISSDFKIQQVNPAMVKLLGFETKEEILGTKILDYAPADKHADWMLLQNKLWHTNMPSFSLETQLIKKDGSVFWCKVTSILFKDNGETLGYTIIEDISERYRLQRYKEDFISVASHELKTPLTLLTANLQVMNRLLQKETVITDKILKLSAKSELFVTKLNGLVSDLLNTTQVEQGMLSLNKTRFKVSKIIDECCNHLQIDGKHAISYKGDRSIEVFADEHKIEQVLLNLVNNAVKYAPNSADIIIEVGQMPDKVKISVTDKGNGISKKDVPFLFDRYFQVKKDRNYTKGLGLGLYISATIIKQHDGHIGVESEPGNGSTFWFTLPL
jgi:PAS domain S-box-containing protein